MARFTPLPLVPALIAAAHAAEVIVQERPFLIEQSFTASALPISGSVVLEPKTKGWSELRVTRILEHGSRVSPGDVLVRFDTSGIDRKIEESRHDLALARLALSRAELEFAHLKERQPEELDALRRLALQAKEDRAYFDEVRRKAEEETADHALKRAKQILAGQQEELRQLGKIAKERPADPAAALTLQRQTEAVDDAEFALRMEIINHQRVIEVTLPRQAAALEKAEAQSLLTVRQAEAEAPKLVDQRRLELDHLTAAVTGKAKALADLEADLALFEFRAPAEGWFYHGAIEHGRWDTGETTRSLAEGSEIETGVPFATFIPGTVKLHLVAFIDAAAANALTPDLSGIATLTGREDVEVPVKFTRLAEVPSPEGQYRAELAATWPSGFIPAPGSTAQVLLVSYEQPHTIVVPNHALTHSSLGWTVEVKLADGKTQRRQVKRGRSSADETEILAGLEPGQVIVLP